MKRRKSNFIAAASASAIFFLQNPIVIPNALRSQGNELINNSEVQILCGVSKATATRYLGELEGIFLEKVGTTGVGTGYVLKGLTKGSKNAI